MSNRTTKQDMVDITKPLIDFLNANNKRPNPGMYYLDPAYGICYKSNNGGVDVAIRLGTDNASYQKAQAILYYLHELRVWG